ncbi:MAG: sulfatase [Planctomycetota bacterium]
MMTDRSNRFLLSLCLIVLFSGAGGCSREEAETSRPKPANILLIVADALRADHLGCYGEELPTSPNIDALSREGALFEDYHTQVPTTLSSFITLFTSLPPKHHGASRNGMNPAPDLDFIGEAFQRAGYETVCFISSYSLSSRFGTRRGFDLFDEKLDCATGLPSNKLIRSAESVTEAFLAWHEKRDSKRPFFAVVHYFDPHWPYIPPERFAKIFLHEEGAPDQASMEDMENARKMLEAGAGPGDPTLQAFHSLYCAEIRYMDHEMGRVMDHLREESRIGDTLVVFTADHGETFWEHEDYFNHGLSVYATNLRIPLIFWQPGRIAPGRFSTPRFSNLDLAPTLLGLAGIPKPKGFAGLNLQNLLAGTAPEQVPSCLFAEATKPRSAEKPNTRPNFFKAKCIMQGPWKLIWTPYKNGQEELYNVEEDQEELLNRIKDPSLAGLRKELMEKLRAWAKDARGDRPEKGMPQEVEDKLKALGYGN